MSYREQHWLADMSVGYELSSGGPATAYSSASPTLQIKGGIRTKEFVSRLNTSNNLKVSVSYSAGDPRHRQSDQPRNIDIDG